MKISEVSGDRVDNVAKIDLLREEEKLIAAERAEKEKAREESRKEQEREKELLERAQELEKAEKKVKPPSPQLLALHFYAVFTSAFLEIFAVHSCARPASGAPVGRSTGSS